MLFNAKSSPHGKTKRQNRRAAHMERQRAPPKGREAENGSRGIDSRGRIPERLRRCNDRYAKEKRAEATAGDITIAVITVPLGLMCLFSKQMLIVDNYYFATEERRQ